MPEIKTDDVDAVELSYHAECGFCGSTHDDYIDKYEFDSIEEAIAASLNDAGWEIVESEKYELITMACPECAEKDDEER